MNKDYPRHFTYNISHTTRPPRKGEVNGVHYFFKTREEMEKEIADGKFLEYVEYNGNLYGTSFESLLTLSKPNRIHIVEINIDGCKALKAKNFDARYIFIAAPDIEVLRSRLTHRQSETEESMRNRLQIAQKEMEVIKGDHFFDLVVVNHRSLDSYKIVAEYLKEDLDKISVKEKEM